MFWLKKNKVQYHLWVFGVITLGIIIATVILIFLFVHKAGNATKPVAGPRIDVEANYQREIIKLREFINSEDRLDKILDKVQDEFLQVRVPADKRGAHLRAWLKFVNAKEALAETDIAEARRELLALLENLLN